MASLVLATGCSRAAGGGAWRGVDCGFAPELAASGVQWRGADGTPRVLPEIARGAGANAVRFRVWNGPPGGVNSLAATVPEAAAWKQAGFRILLNLHYSDSWADPGKQTKPAAWAGLSGGGLEEAVFAFTRDAVAAMHAGGAAPEMVQIGNEITAGMLWDNGRVGGAFETPGQWQAFGGLLRAGVRGALEGVPAGASPPLIMVHCDRGGDAEGALWFYRNVRAQGVSFDVIGLSYYPFWHGGLEKLEGTLGALAGEFTQDLVVVETAYPWTLGWQDATNNMVGLPEHVLPGYPATPEGQLAFLREVQAVVRRAPHGRGKGVFYWAPEWVAGGTPGSAWENLALFDAEHRALPAWKAFASEGGGWALH